MKTKLLKMGVSFLMAGIMLASCKKDNMSAGNSSPAQLSFGVQGDNPLTSFNSMGSSSTTALAGSTTGGSITWTSGIANISGFKLEAEKTGLEIEIRSRELTTVDLFAPSPRVISAAIDTGTYTKIEIRVEFSRSNTSTLPLVLKGTFTTATGTNIPMEFDLNDNVEIKAQSTNVVVNGTKNLVAIVLLHLNKLFDNISTTDINNATTTNGTIIISGSSNSMLYDKIVDNLSRCGESRGFEEHDRD